MNVNAIKVEYKHVSISAYKVLTAHCNEITFINKGSVVANINCGDTLQLTPGESITYPGRVGEFNTTDYYISFPGGSSNGNLVVAVLKIYQNPFG